MNPTSAPGHALRWWSAAQLDLLAGSLATRMQTWRTEWAPWRSEADACLSCVLAEHEATLAAAEWLPLGGGTGRAWLEVGGDTVPRLAAWLFARHDDGPRRDAAPLASAMARRALAGLSDVLVVGLALSPGADRSRPSPALFRSWSGAVIASLGGSGATAVRVLLDAHCVASLVPARQLQAPARSLPMTPLHAALAGRRVRGGVTLAGCEIDIGTLGSLRVGDVLALPHPLDAPAVVVCGDATLWTAYLGRQGSGKAIELTRDPSPTSTGPAS